MPQIPAEEERTAFRSRINHKYSGETLIGYLCQRFRYHSQNRWQEYIQSGEVLLNDQKTQEDRLLILGDEVKYMARSQAEPQVPKQIPIVFEDRDLLVVNKPAHLPVHPAGRYLRNTLINVLKKQKSLDFLILAHRLDRETSGLCVLAKTPLAKDKMYWAFFNNEVDKSYWSLVWGQPPHPAGSINAPIGKARKEESRIRIKQSIKGENAKTAKTKFRTLSTRWVEAPHWSPPEWPSLEKCFKNPHNSRWPISLIEAKPITGRTNQIRVHLAHLGCGVVGDKLYDPSEEVFLRFHEKKPEMEKQSPNKKSFMRIPKDLVKRLVLDAHALHAQKISFRHPRTGKMMTLSAAAPPSWRSLMNAP